MEALRLNLGAGGQKIRGYKSVDISDKCNPDYVYDITKTPYPWEDVDEIRMDNLAEHIEAHTFIKVVNECHRILKKGGKLWIRVPELRADNLIPCFTDPTHINYFTDQTFQYYEKGHARHEAFGKDYGIVPWSKKLQRRSGIFLEVTLIK